MSSSNKLVGVLLVLVFAVAIVFLVTTFGRTFITPADAIVQRDALFAETVRELASHSASVRYQDMFVKTSALALSDTDLNELSKLLQGTHLPWEKEKRLYSINLRLYVTLMDKTVTVLEVFADLNNPNVNFTFRVNGVDPLVFSLVDSTGLVMKLFSRMKSLSGSQGH